MMTMPAYPRRVFQGPNGQLTESGHKWMGEIVKKFTTIDGSLGDLTNASVIPAPGNLVVINPTGDGFADSGKAPPDGDVVGTTDTQELTNKTLTEPTLTLKAVNAGSFTMTAGNITTVDNSAVTADCIVVFSPANNAAATLLGGVETPYILASDYVADVSFKVRCRGAGSAAGTEIFNYFLFDKV